jgi:hypothetical protein
MTLFKKVSQVKYLGNKPMMNEMMNVMMNVMIYPAKSKQPIVIDLFHNSRRSLP